MTRTRIMGFTLLAILLADSAQASNLYALDLQNGRIDTIGSNGSVSVLASGILDSISLAIDKAGNLYAGTYSVGLIDRVTPDGTVSTYADLNVPYLTALAIDNSGTLYAAGGSSNISENVYKFESDGTFSTFATFSLPGGTSGIGGMVFDSANNLYVSNGSNGSIDKVSPDGTISYFAQGSGPLAIDGSGNLYSFLFGGFTGTGNSGIEKIAPDGTSSILAEYDSLPAAMTIDSNGDLYVTSGSNGSSGSVIDMITPDGTISTFATLSNLADIRGLAIAPSTAAVPEPSSMLMLGLGSMGLVGVGLRRRQPRRVAHS